MGQGFLKFLLSSIAFFCLAIGCGFKANPDFRVTPSKDNPTTSFNLDDSTSEEAETETMDRRQRIVQTEESETESEPINEPPRMVPTPQVNVEADENFVPIGVRNGVQFFDQFNNPELSRAARVRCSEPEEVIAEATLILVNFMRTQGMGCQTRMFGGPASRALFWDRNLYTVAHMHSTDMVENGFFNHRGSDGSKVKDRIRRTNWSGRSVAENITRGYDYVGQVVVGFVDSTEHCEIMLHPAFDSIGLACVPSNIDYWTMVLGEPR